MSPRRLLSAVLLFLGALSGCTDSLLQPRPAEETTLDDRLAIRGQVCTSAPDPTSFKVKVLFLIDKSGSMCMSDPPGALADGGLCEYGTATEPGRVRSLRELMPRLAAQPNVEVALAGFESNVTPVVPGLTGFVPASQVDQGTIASLQAALGKGTDYQGALSHAVTRITLDIEDVERSHPEQLPRTKYVVVLLTDGTPYPRCSLVDPPPADVIGSATNPMGIWQDSDSYFCNGIDQTVTIDGFQAETDRNQNYQIYEKVTQLTALKDRYNIGDIRLHTILLFNVESVNDCIQNVGSGSDSCRMLYNGLPDGEAARSVAAYTLGEIARLGNGTYQEFTSTAELELGSLDYASLDSRFVLKTLLATNVHAFPTLEGPKVDSDGDGLIDPLDKVSFDPVGTAKTSRLDADSDGDGFSDGFEASRRGEGFDPNVPDARGCSIDSTNPDLPPCSDVDGDGLTEQAELLLNAHHAAIRPETFADSDHDGLPDGLEVLVGLDPFGVNGRLKDTDLDSVPDYLELLQHTHPLIDDRQVHPSDSYRYEIKATLRDDGSSCYDYVISNIRLVTPDRQVNGQIGFNRIELYFGEAPESSVSIDYGRWRRACATVQFAPPSVRVPAGPEIQLPEDQFRYLDEPLDCWSAPQ